MKYQDMLSHVFASAFVPDGYFGGLRRVSLAFHAESGKTIEVYESGCHTSALPLAIDMREATFLLLNHPSNRRYSHVKITEVI